MDEYSKSGSKSDSAEARQKAMDEYSKTGPGSYAALARLRERERNTLLAKALAQPTEAGFIAGLRDKLGISKEHPGYLPAIKLWRMQHP
jgi:hypothetical protein